MLQKIIRINNFRVFQNWREDPASPDFARVNVVYGINGSGKSSLSSVLAGASADTTWASGLRVRIKNGNDEVVVVDTHDASFWQNVHVFAKDYVTANLRFDLGGQSTTKPLLVLGKKKIDQRERLAEIEKRLSEIETDCARLDKDRKKAERDAAQLATKTATTITEELAAAGARYAPRSYDARRVKSLLSAEPATDVSADIQADLATVNGNDLQPLSAVSHSRFDSARLEAEIVELLKRKATSEPLQALADDVRRAHWVQEGLSMHATGDPCAFCGNELTADRVAELERHFDKSLLDLQEACTSQGERVRQAITAVETVVGDLPDKAALDSSLHDEWDQVTEAIQVNMPRLVARLHELEALVERKASSLFTSTEVPKDLPGTNVLDLSAAVDVIERHNQLAGDSSKRRTAAAQRVENSRVEAIRSDFDAANKKAGTTSQRLGELGDERRQLDRESRTLAQQDLDATPLAGSLNDDVKRLLGRDELTFELADDGYAILRRGEPALYLSEGEKTAISLLYFLKGLDAHDCDRANAIVIIDDPVSSLDSNVVAGVSAHLWARLVGGDKCRQLFLLTHSFDLFRAWTNQLDRLPEALLQSQDITFTTQELRTRTKTDAQGLKIREPFFMPWPTNKKLRNRLRSEYHYLFWRAADTLATCQSEPSPEAELDAAAVLPNVCRRLLEGFLSFKYPQKIGDFRGLVEEAIGTLDESVTRTRLVTYLHHYSHNEEGDISKPVARPESVRILGAVFDLIHRVDPDHYQKMCSALQVEPELLDV